MRKGRIEEYDIARGIAVIGMVLVHTYMGLCSYTGEWFYYFCYIPGTPFAAPVFMLLLGGNQVMTEKNSPSQIFKRFQKMALITLLYTTIGYALPHVFYSLMNNDLSHWNMALDSLLTVDILQFATITMLFFAICKKLKIGNLGMISAAVFLQILKSLFFGNDYIAEKISLGLWFNRLFIGNASKSYFPFVCWMLFPIIGKVFAEKMLCSKDKTQFYKKTFLISSCICVGSIVLNLYLNKKIGLPLAFSTSRAYEQMHLVGNILFTSFAITWISICYFLLPYIPQNVKQWLIAMSKNTTVIYCIHFPIIRYCLLLCFDGQPCLGVIGTILCTIALLSVGNLVAFYWNKIKNN